MAGVNTRRLGTLWLPLVVSFVAAGCAADSSTSGPTARTATSGDRGPGAPPFSRAVHLADGTLPDGRVIRLRAIRDDGGACLLIVGIDPRTRGCGRVAQGRRPPLRRPVLAEATVAREGADHREIFAATSARVARVRLLADGAELAPEQSLLLRADDVAALGRAGITSGPFGYFFAEVPRRAEHIRAVAVDRRGSRIGVAAFDHLSTMGELFILG